MVHNSISMNTAGRKEETGCEIDEFCEKLFLEKKKPRQIINNDDEVQPRLAGAAG